MGQNKVLRQKTHTRGGETVLDPAGVSRGVGTMDLQIEGVHEGLIFLL